MPIVAYGYGLGGGTGDVTNIFVEDIVVAMEAEPDITLESDIAIEADTDDVAIEAEPEIEIEVD